jgi:two-component system, LytTR family, response regulator
MKITAVVVEDEPLSRRTVTDFCSELDDIEVVGEAVDGKQAFRMIEELEPHLVFLDVQIPELSGLEVLQRLRRQPQIIFTSAYDSYAVRAFELNAVDYLLKPFGKARFRAAVSRAVAQIERRHAMAAEGSSTKDPPIERLFLRHRGRIVPVRIRDVIRFEAAGEYVEIHTSGGETYLTSAPMTELEQRLDLRRFRRVHRAHIVNLDRVASMESYDERRLLVTMEDGSTIVASRSGSQMMRELVD